LKNKRLGEKKGGGPQEKEGKDSARGPHRVGKGKGNEGNAAVASKKSVSQEKSLPSLPGRSRAAKNRERKKTKRRRRKRE